MHSKKSEERSGYNRFYLFMYTAVFRFKMALKRLRVFGVNNEAAVVLPELILFLKLIFSIFLFWFVEFTIGVSYVKYSSDAILLDVSFEFLFLFEPNM